MPEKRIQKFQNLHRFLIIVYACSMRSMERRSGNRGTDFRRLMMEVLMNIVGHEELERWETVFTSMTDPEMNDIIIQKMSMTCPSPVEDISANRNATEAAGDNACDERISAPRRAGILAIEGFQRSGKDSLVQHLRSKDDRMQDANAFAFADAVKKVVCTILEPVHPMFKGCKLHSILSGCNQHLKGDKTFFAATGNSLRDFVIALANDVYKPAFGSDCWARLLFGMIPESLEGLWIITDLRFVEEFRVLRQYVTRHKRRCLHVRMEWKDNPAKNDKSTIRDLVDARAKGLLKYDLHTIRHNREGFDDPHYQEHLSRVYEKVCDLM